MLSLVLTNHHLLNRRLNYRVNSQKQKRNITTNVSSFSFRFNLGEQILNPFQCSYRCRVLCHFPNEIETNPFDEDAISRVKENFIDHQM